MARDISDVVAQFRGPRDMAAQRVMEIAEGVMDRPWRWGEADCCTAACDVFAALTGVDPMASLRGRYSTEQGAYRHIVRAGGMLALASRLADDAQLFRVRSNFRAGDLGVSLPGAAVGPGGRALAVCVGTDLWAVKGRRGMTLVTKVSMVWRWAS